MNTLLNITAALAGNLLCLFGISLCILLGQQLIAVGLCLLAFLLVVIVLLLVLKQDAPKSRKTR